MIRILFNQPEKALKLYGDITGKTFAPGTPVEIKTLENVFLSKLRNDLAFIVDNKLVVIMEHQSTLNKNTPLRVLQYVLLFYELFFILGNTLYQNKIIKLPNPEFFMLYNGNEAYPPRGIMRLSEAFMDKTEDEEVGLELNVNVININYGINREILQKNADLNGYALFVEKLRGWQAREKSLSESVRLASEECIAESVLVDFLTKHKGEIDAMFTLMYDENKARQVAREEGIEEGLVIGVDISAKIIMDLKKNKPIEEISARYKISTAKVEQLQSLLTI
jgi:hypothetical protein